MNEHTMQKGMMKGALILTIAGILAKMMSALYRVPFQNIAGDIGYYVYQQVYPFYGISFALAMYGFPVVISKMIVESERKDAKYTKQDVIITSTSVLTVIFGLFFVSLYFGSSFFTQLMKDPSLLPALHAVSYSFLTLPFVSILRGVYQGNKDMLPTAISQVTEQFFRVTFILIICSWLVMSHGSPYSMGTGAAFGGVVGSVIALVTLLFFLPKVKKQKLTKETRYVRSNSTKLLVVSRRLLFEGIAIALSTTILVIFQLIDAFQIPSILAEIDGLSEVVKMKKGVFDRGQPLLQLGIVVATSMSLSLIPHISAAHVSNNTRTITNSIVSALKIGIIIGGAASVGLAIIIKPTNIMLFTNSSGSITLGVLGVTILFATIALIAAALLQGLGETFVTMKHVLIGVLCKIVLNIMLISNFDILGAAFSSVIATAIIALLNVSKLFKLVPELATMRFYSIRIMISLMVMAFITFMWKSFLIEILPVYESKRLVATFISLSSVLIGGITYFICLMKIPVWEQSEIEQFPRLKRMISIVGKRKGQKE